MSDEWTLPWVFGLVAPPLSPLPRPHLKGVSQSPITLSPTESLSNGQESTLGEQVDWGQQGESHSD